MPPFAINNVNVVFLFGQEACKHYEQLIQYWHAIIKPADWERLIFIQVTHEPFQPQNIPQGLLEPLARNSYSLEPGKNLPTEIARAIMQRMEGGQVVCHCICSDLDQFNPQEGNPADLMESMGSFFSTGMKVLYYLMLKYSMGENVEGQRLFLQDLEKHQNAGKHSNIYLVSKVASDLSTQKSSACWRALLHEVMINCASRRVLSEGKLYSIGYSVLNADDSELRNLRIHRMAHLAEQLTQRDFSTEETFAIIAPGLISRGIHGVLESELREWLGHQVQELLHLPNEKERETNRILSCIDSETPENIAASIKRFYRLNNRKVDWATHFSKSLHAMKSQLASKVNAPSFPLAPLENILQLLSNLEDMSPPPVPMPRKSILKPGPIWRNEYAVQVEKHYADYFISGNVARAAAAFKEVCEKFLAYVRSIKQNNNAADIQIIDENQYHTLSEKYPAYNESVKGISHTQLDRVFASAWLDTHGPYFDQTGLPLNNQFLAILQEGEKLLQQELPQEFKGSFTESVSVECTSDEELGMFFDQNLMLSKRMFRNIHDTGHKEQSLFFADSAFQHHPWIRNKQADCVIAENDNVERVDLYPLTHTISWYLNDPDNRYFESLQHENGNTGTVGRIFTQATQNPAKPGNVVLPPQTIANDTYKPEESLDIRIEGEEYILHWDWKQGTPNAMIKVVQQGRVLMNTAVSNASFISGQGVNISGKLPYGKVTISIFSDGELYLVRDLPGKRRLVYYNLERSNRGTMELKLEGKPDDIARLVLHAPGEFGKQDCYYPIHRNPTKTLHTFKNLRLTDSAQVVSDPGDEFPEVIAVQKNMIPWRSDV